MPLIQTRKIGEAIVIEGKATITVLSVHAGRVKLGVTSDRPTTVRRVEKPASKAIERATESAVGKAHGLPARHQPARAVR